jgi:hypothetical protein
MLRLCKAKLKNEQGNGSKGSTVSLVAGVVDSVYCQVSRLLVLEFATLYILYDGTKSVCGEHRVKSISIG